MKPYAILRPDAHYRRKHEPTEIPLGRIIATGSTAAVPPAGAGAV
jgi:hypothetical protein